MAKKNKVNNDKFEEIADYGDKMYFIRDFSTVEVSVKGKDKEVPLVLVADIMDYYEDTGEDEFEEKPFNISINIMPKLEVISKSIKKSAADSASIEPDEIQYTDISDYMGGVPLLLTDLEESFETMEEAVDFLKSDELRKQLNAQSVMIGFYLDGSINRIGDSRWSYLQKMVE